MATAAGKMTISSGKGLRRGDQAGRLVRGIGHFVTIIAHVRISLPDSVVRNRRRGGFRDRLEDIAMPLPMISKPVPHGVRLLPGVVFLIPETSSAILVSPVRLDQFCGHDRVLRSQLSASARLEK